MAIDPPKVAAAIGRGWRGWLGGPIDIASLAAFRILFGLLMTAAMTRFLAKGWVDDLYAVPRFHFPYAGLGWLQPWPGVGMHVHFVLLGLLALMVAAGFCYRAAIILFAVGFTYVELIDQTTFLNHYYLISLLSGLLVLLPAHRAWSVDVWLEPSLGRDQVPRWTIHVLRFQVAVVYIFAGLAKLNSDWLLGAQPLRIWLAARSDLPFVGGWLQKSWVAYSASWIGAAYDLSIVFFLLFRKTRTAAFIAVVLFHVATWLLFHIGMFPWIMIVASTVFFSPDWARVGLTQFAANAGRYLRQPAWCRWASSFCRPSPATINRETQTPQWLFVFLTLYAVIQIVLPLRPYLLGDGHPAWNYRGFNLAWQVMVAEKTGYVEFYARDPATGFSRKLEVRNYLTPLQDKLMAQDPYLIQVLAKKIADDVENAGQSRPQIVVQAFATLNGRPSQRLINPEVDLGRGLSPSAIVPLQE